MFFIIGGDGKEYGPVTSDQVRGWIANGRANADTRAKLDGTDAWRRLGDFPEFGGTLPSSTPAVTTYLPPPLGSATSPVYPSTPVSSGLPPASRGLRFLGAIIDWVISCIFSIPTFVFVGRGMMEMVRSNSFDPTAMTELMSTAMYKSVPSLAVLVVIQAALISMRGQSLGKLITGLKIVRFRDETSAGFARGFLVRSAVPTVVEQIPVVGFLFHVVDVCFIFRDDARCLHDLMADTKVIKASDQRATISNPPHSNLPIA